MTTNPNKTRRLKLEAVIRDGLTAAHAALYEIFSKKLFMPDYPSFAAYALEVFGYSEPYARRLIHFAEFLNDWPNGKFPQALTEGSYRPLHRLKSRRQMEKAVERLAACVDCGTAVTAEVTEAIAEEISPTRKNQKPQLKIDLEVFATEALAIAEQATQLAQQLAAAGASKDVGAGLAAIQFLSALATEAMRTMGAIPIRTGALSKTSNLQKDLRQQAAQTVASGQPLSGGLAHTVEVEVKPSLSQATDPMDHAPALVEASPVENAAIDTSLRGTTAQSAPAAEVARSGIPPITSLEDDLNRGWIEQPLTAQMAKDGAKVESHAYRALDFTIRIALRVTPGKSHWTNGCVTPPWYSRTNDAAPFGFETVLPESKLPRLMTEIRFAVNYLKTGGDLSAMGAFGVEMIHEAEDWIERHAAGDAKSAA